MGLGRAQGADVMNYVPPLLRSHSGRERRHRSSVEASEQVAEHISIRLPAFEARSTGKVERCDGITLVVGKCSDRRAMAAPVFAVTGPAIHALEKFGAPLHALGRVGRFSRYGHGFAGLLLLERGRKGFYICNQVGALLSQQRLP